MRGGSAGKVNLWTLGHDSAAVCYRASPWVTAVNVAHFSAS
jgi:hypothetical protein